MFWQDKIINKFLHRTIIAEIGIISKTKIKFVDFKKSLGYTNMKNTAYMRSNQYHKSRRPAFIRAGSFGGVNLCQILTKIRLTMGKPYPGLS